RLVNRTNPAQTLPSRPSDRASDKILELLIALAVLGLTSDIELEDVNGSARGPNPDILARMPDGKLWGFACKAIHGDAPRTLFERLSEGIAQIEASPAEMGSVIISFRNRLPHEAMFPVVEEAGSTPRVVVYPNPWTAFQELHAFVSD